MASRKARKQRKQKQQDKLRLPNNVADILKQGLIALRRNNIDEVGKLVTRALELNPSLQEQANAQIILVEAYFRAATNNAQERLKYLDEAIKINPKVAKVRHYRALVLWRDYLENKTNSLRETLTEMLSDLDIAYELEPKRDGVAYLQQLIKLVLASGELELEDESLNEEKQAILANIKNFLKGTNEGTYIDNSAFTSELWQLLADMKISEDSAPKEDLRRLDQGLRKAGDVPQRARGIVHYYLGVAEARQGNLARAATIWLEAKRLTYNSTHLSLNLGQGQIEQAFQAIEEGKWQQAIKTLFPFVEGKLLNPETKIYRFVLETLAYAHENAAYEAALASNWSQAKQQWQKAMSYSSKRHIFQNLALVEEALNNWDEAALAWRDLLKRRPRKENNPEYLTDSQVMALWRHAAECHSRDPSGGYEEAIHCLKKAVQYADAESELEIRQEIVDTLQKEGRYDASENELKRILELDPENIQALLKLATFYDEKNSWWKNDSLPFWKRAHLLDLRNQEAKDGLARAYINRLERSSPKEVGRILNEALDVLPNHPKLLVFRAEEFYYKKDSESALEFLEQAYKIAPEDKTVLAMVLSKLALLNAKRKINTILFEVRQVPSVSPKFWIRLADDVYEQSLGRQDMPTGRLLNFFGERAPSHKDPEEHVLLWMKTFLDEGIALAEKNELAKQYSGDTTIQSKVEAFLFAYESADATQDEKLIDYYKERIINEFEDIGLLEYVEAFTMFDGIDNTGTKQEVQDLLMIAQRKAKKSNNKELLEAVRTLKGKLSSPFKHTRIPKEIERLLEELELE